jgi:hypothetical protein
MSATEALRAAHAAGVCITVDGDDLLLTAPSEPPATVLDLLSQHKPAIVRFLQPLSRNWSAEDWRAFFDERAGIAEFDGGLSRAEAEAQAFACCVDEWLNHHPVPSPPGRCLACGGGEQAHDALVRHGIEPTTHAWLHSRCWTDWYAAREAEARTALAKLGITAPRAILHDAHFSRPEVVRQEDDIVESPASAEYTVAPADPSKAFLLCVTADLRVVSDDLQWIVQTRKGNASAKSSGWRSRHFCRSREGLQLVLGRLLGRDGVPAHVAASISTLPEWHQPSLTVTRRRSNDRAEGRRRIATLN